jgi:hypothetical protein
VPLCSLNVEFVVRLSVVVQSVMAPLKMILSINVNFYDEKLQKCLKKNLRTFYEKRKLKKILTTERNATMSLIKRKKLSRIDQVYY